MRISEVQGWFEMVLQDCGDIEVSDISEDNIPDELALRILRDVDLTILDDGRIWATAWDLDRYEDSGTKTDILDLLNDIKERIDWATNREDWKEDVALLRRIGKFVADWETTDGQAHP